MVETKIITLDGRDHEVDASLTRADQMSIILDTLEKEEEKKKNLQPKKSTTTIATTPNKADIKETKPSELEATVKNTDEQLSKKTPENDFLKTKVFAERYTDEDPENPIYDVDLIKDPKFVSASKVIFEMNKGRAWDYKADGSDEDLAKYGITAMGYFNYNLPIMVLDAGGLITAEDHQKRAFLYAMEAYDDLGVSAAGTWRLAKGLGLDITTWSALFTFGTTAMAAQTAKIATKEGVKLLIANSMKILPYGALNGVVYGGIDATGREIVRSGGTDTDFSGKNVLEGAAYGAAFGGALAIGGNTLINVAKSTMSKKSGEIGNKLFGQSKTSKAINNVDLLKPVDVGIKVKSSPKGKTGVVEEIVDGKAKVSFTNKKTGATTTREIPVEKLKSVSPIDKPVSPEINQIIDETPGKIRSSFQNLLTKINEVLPEGKGKGGLRDDGTQSLVELKNLTKNITDYLQKMDALEPGKFARFIDKAKLTREQEQLLMTSAQQVSETYITKMQKIAKSIKEDSLSMEDYNRLFSTFRELNTLKTPIQEVYNTISGQSGATLKSTQIYGKYTLGKGRDLDIEDLLKTHSEDATIDEFMKLIDHIDNQAIQSAEIRNLKKEYADLIENGDFKEARLSRREHDKLVAEEKSAYAKTILGKAYAKFNYGVRIFNEIAISNVFSSSTLIINTLPSLAKVFYKPLVNNLGTNGFTWKAYRQMTAEYAAISGSFQAARKAAQFAFRYERSMLTGDTARFLETQTMIPKKYGGGFVRIFPRLLLTTDAFFEQIMYRQFINGELVAKTIEDGFKKGHSKAKINADYDIATKKMLKDSYEPAPNAADILTDQAIDLGFVGRGGKEIDDWVAEKLTKFNKNTEDRLLQQATNKAGRNAVQDSLFKRGFEKDNLVGAGLDWYEKAINRHPIARFMGQLFFRTPVRVLEEGMRLTPGLNLLMPDFLSDLAGKGTRHAQARAAGEVLVGQAIAGGAVSLWMTGNITGSQGKDYKIARHGEDAGFLPPYSIRNPITGTVTNWRNLDPFSTPLKLLINGFEALQTISYREQQGEYINERESKSITDKMMVSVTVLISLIRDGNLFAGLEEGIQFGADMADDEHESEFLIFVGKKLQTMIPNQHFKMRMLNHPVLGDPQTIEESLLYRLNPDNDPETDSVLSWFGLDNSSVVNLQHTALGDVRKVSSPAGAIWGVFDGITVEEKDARYKVKKPDGTINENLSDKKDFVQKYLANLAYATDQSFYAPVKPQTDYWLGVKNGKELYLPKDEKYPKESLYMRMQRIFKEDYQEEVVDRLYDILKDQPPLGTPSTKGKFKTETSRAVTEILNGYRKKVYAQLGKQQVGVEPALDYSLGEANKTLGARETGNKMMKEFN